MSTTTAAAEAYFAAKLAHETDPTDVHSAMGTGRPGFVLVDTRSLEAWDQGHARGAIHLPRAALEDGVRSHPEGTAFVVYCWGPGCNGATTAALAIARLGYPVREMIGGFEYWAREGLPVDSANGSATRPPDSLVAPVGPDGRPLACDC